MSLTIGAMELLSSGYKHFCLVTGDGDYVPLVCHLVKKGCTVVVIGTARAATALKEAASQFLTTEQLVPHATPPAKPRAKGTATPLTGLPRLLAEAYRVARQESDTDWVLLARLGVALRQLTPDFEESYSKQQLSVQLRQYPDLFELRQRTSGNGEVDEVRLRPSIQQVS